MGRKTSVYLTDEDARRVRALGFPPLGEVIRAGLTVLETALGGPAHDRDDSQLPDGGPAQHPHGSQMSYGGPAVRSRRGAFRQQPVSPLQGG